MSPARTRTAQQRDARELAITAPADPYRGALTDPFSPAPVARAATSQPARGLAAPPPRAPIASTAGDSTPQPATDADGSSSTTARSARPAASGSAPAPASLAGIIAILLGITLGLLGMVLLTLLSLQNEYGAPDRSFYSGTDSGYVVLALVDFGLAGCASIGAIVFLTGRVSGRVAMTFSGWATLALAAFWNLRGHVHPAIPLVIGAAAAVMLALSYQASVTRWLGVLSPPQPE